MDIIDGYLVKWLYAIGRVAYVAVISSQHGVNTCFRKLMRKAGIKINYIARSMDLRKLSSLQVR